MKGTPKEIFEALKEDLKGHESTEALYVVELIHDIETAEEERHGVISRISLEVLETALEHLAERTRDALCRLEEARHA